MGKLTSFSPSLVWCVVRSGVIVCVCVKEGQKGDGAGTQSRVDPSSI